MSWLHSLTDNVPRFLSSLQSHHKPGFYSYSHSGDLYDEHTHWGLGNAVFATKILHTLRQPKPPALTQFILTFRQPNYTIFDPLIRKKTWLKDKLVPFTTGNWQNFWHQQVITAETRQAIAALHLLGQAPAIPKQLIPQTPTAVTQYLDKLDWSKPWGAASHFSHLLFFLHHSSIANKRQLIDQAIARVSKLQHQSDGAWYQGTTTLQHKVNGAMKIITGFNAAACSQLNYPRQLIDLCLHVPNDQDACSNFNCIYVLKYASQAAPDYKVSAIRLFAQQRLDIYQQYYYPRHGGFSFLPGSANTHYYGAKITQGLDEPDIHGTVMFLWGISIIAQLLNLNLGLKVTDDCLPGRHRSSGLSQTR